MNLSGIEMLEEIEVVGQVETLQLNLSGIEIRGTLMRITKVYHLQLNLSGIEIVNFRRCVALGKTPSIEP